MLQTVGGTGSIQVAQAGGTQQLQQLQVVPASGIQVSWEGRERHVKLCFTPKETLK